MGSGLSRAGNVEESRGVGRGGRSHGLRVLFAQLRRRTRPPARPTRAHFFFRDRARAPKTGCRFRRAVDRAARVVRPRAVSSAFLKVTMPEMEMSHPSSRQPSASAGVPVKQWMTVRGGTPSLRKMSKRSSKASRACTTRARSSSLARAIWAEKACRCWSLGECS